MNEIIRCLTRSMKIIGLIACLFVSLSGWIAAQTNPPLDDPLFGIGLNPTQVHFEISPQELARFAENYETGCFGFSRTQ